MEWCLLEDQEKLIAVAKLLVSKKTQIKVKLKGAGPSFTSKFIHLVPQQAGKGGSPSGPEGFRMVMEELVPESGNSLIQSARDVTVEADVENRLLYMEARYAGVNKTAPYVGLILDCPPQMKIKDTRKNRRFGPKMPEFISVEFKLGEEGKEERLYELNVLNYSKHGLGILVPEKETELLSVVVPGYVIRGMIFFASWTMIKVDAEVIHVTQLKSEKYRGYHLVGLEPSEIIESARPPEQEDF